MALQSSGQIKFSEIEAEFGSNGGRTLGNYRISQTVGQLTNLPLDSGIPQSGQIKFSDFLGKELNIIVDCFENGNSNYNFDAYSNRFANGDYVIVGNFRSSIVKSQWAGGKTVIIHINKEFGSNGASNRNDCAFCTGPQNNNNSQPGWPSSTELSVNVGTEGYVAGKGGKGGRGRDVTQAGGGHNPGENGFPGTSAMKIISGTTIIGESRIFAGGGGGGGGGSIYMGEEASEDAAPHPANLSGAGGGGGAGVPAGEFGEGPHAEGAPNLSYEGGGADGNDGSRTTGGEGGAYAAEFGSLYDDDDPEAGRPEVRSGAGGDGGNRGANGGDGTEAGLVNQGHQDYSSYGGVSGEGGLAGHKYRTY